MSVAVAPTSHRAALPVTAILVLATVVALMIVIAARQVFEVSYYRAQTSATLVRISTSLRSLGEVQAKVEDGSLDDAQARALLVAATADGQAAVAPLTASARLHGTFLEPQDTAAQQVARQIEADLQQIPALLDYDGPGSTMVAARIDHVLASAAASSVPLGLPADAASHAHAYWLRAYVRDVKDLDRDFQENVDDFQEWRTSRLAPWIENDRWDDMQFRTDRLLGELRKSSAKFAALPVPVEMQAAAQRFDLAQPILERALASFSDYVKGRAGVPRLLVQTDQDLAGYKVERAAALADMDRVVANVPGATH
jgi:hypothetical protein